jgi:hypothetical protein
MHSDSKKRRSFHALLFAAGDAKRYIFVEVKGNAIDQFDTGC